MVWLSTSCSGYKFLAQAVASAHYYLPGQLCHVNDSDALPIFVPKLKVRLTGGKILGIGLVGWRGGADVRPMSLELHVLNR